MPLVVACVFIVGVKLEVSQIFYARAWHDQNNHHLEMSRWDFVVPSSWFPRWRESDSTYANDYATLVRASFFDPSSQTVDLFPSPGDLEDFQKNVTNTANVSWVKSPVLQLRGEPGTCIVHDSAEHTSGYCIFPKEDLMVYLSNLDKRSMKEVAALLSSTTPHPLRKRLSESHPPNR